MKMAICTARMSVNGDVDPDGDLWFFTGASSPVSEIAKLPKVNVVLRIRRISTTSRSAVRPSSYAIATKSKSYGNRSLRCGSPKARTIRRSRCCASISKRPNIGTARQARWVILNFVSSLVTGKEADGGKTRSRVLGSCARRSPHRDTSSSTGFGTCMS